MKTKHLFWGFMFLTLGILVLLNNISSIDFYWLNIWDFWPLFLILIGISMLIREEAIRAVVISITGIIVGAAIFSTFKSSWGFVKDEVIVDLKHGVQIKDIDDEDLETKVFEEEFRDDIKYGTLNFRGGAGSFRISDTTSNLISTITKAYDNQYSLVRSDNGENVKLVLNDDNDRGVFVFRGKKNNRAYISLNPIPVWKMDFDLGAAKIDFNLSEYKVEDLDIDMGAASLEIKLGDLIDSARVTIDAGASSVEIYIPENSGCELRSDNFLSSRKLEDFVKIKDNLYRTENFDSAEKKIYMDIDTGVSSLRIKKYSVANNW